MKIMLVDDERLALKQLQTMLEQCFNEYDIKIRSFQFVSDAIDETLQFSPDVVFLDIHMPEMSGLEAAEHILQLHPHVEIIFVTAYDEFAIQAFELNALDYLLKPVSMSRLEKTINRVKRAVKTEQHEQPTKFENNQKIFCFNKIRFQLNGQEIIYPKWRTAKAQELFAYLIHRRGEYVSKYKIINMFTPEIDKKRGMTQLYTNIYQVRRCLKELGVEFTIENDSIQESYCLKIENTVLDFVEWEQNIKQLNMAKSNFYEQLEELVLSYEGNYMGDYDYQWADTERERLLQVWLAHAKMLVQYYEQSEQWTKIITIAEKQFYFNPYEYEQALPLLRAYAGLGQLDKVKQYYDKYDKECLEELDLPLPDIIVEWYESWLAMNII